MKSTNEACCSLFQSSYLKIVKDRFLPPPVPVLYSQNGVIEWAKDDKEASYLSMLTHATTKSCRPYLQTLQSLFGKYQIKAIPLLHYSNFSCVAFVLDFCYERGFSLSRVMSHNGDLT